MRTVILSLLLTLLSGKLSLAQQLPFTQATITLPPLAYSASAWGDFDRDGDLDLALSGAQGITPVTKVLRNDNGFFSDVETYPSLHYGSVEWGDADLDGDLDLLITGIDDLGNPYSWVIINILGTFNLGGFSLPGLVDGQATFGDINNDGQPDVLLAGNSMARIYRYDGIGQYTNIDAGLPNVEAAMCSWVDYNNDGQQDVLICGNTGGGMISDLYRNNNGIFTRVAVAPEPFTGLYGGQVKWADLDNDGDQDLVIAGMDLYVDGYFIFYRNDGNDIFTKFAFPEASLLNPYFDLADYNADGLTDVALIGTMPGCGGPPVMMLLENGGAFNFSIISTLIPGFKLGSVSWGDYNGDGQSDLLLTGLDVFDVPTTSLYLNNLGNPSSFALNTPPAAPHGVSGTCENGNAVLHWNTAVDAQSSKNGLTYNLCIGTQPDNYDILSPLSVMTTGARIVSSMGNTGSSDTSYILKSLAAGNYYARVQAVDNGFMGGPFSETFPFTYTPAVGMDQGVAEEFGISPNPCTDRIHIHTNPENGQVSRLRIISVSGMIMYNGSAVNELEVGTWPAGVYTILLTDGTSSRTFPLVKF